MPIADVTAEVVLVDDLAHVAQDFGSSRDRRTGPGLEAIAEGIEIAVRADARIAVSEPGTAEAFLSFKDDKARPGALLGEVIRSTDPGDTCPNDHNVEVLGPGLWLRLGECSCLGHRFWLSRRLSAYPIRVVDRSAMQRRAWPIKTELTSLADNRLRNPQPEALILELAWDT